MYVCNVMCAWVHSLYALWSVEKADWFSVNESERAWRIALILVNIIHEPIIIIITIIIIIVVVVAVVAVIIENPEIFLTLLRDIAFQTSIVESRLHFTISAILEGLKRPPIERWLVVFGPKLKLKLNQLYYILTIINLQ